MQKDGQIIIALKTQLESTEEFKKDMENSLKTMEEAMENCRKYSTEQESLADQQKQEMQRSIRDAWIVI